MRSRGFLAAVACLLASSAADAVVDFEEEVWPILESRCFACHGDEEEPKGGLNLERFGDEVAVMRDRAVWAGVLEKIESHQMPPPKRRSQPSAEERAKVVDWIGAIAARPDPLLGQRDPGKPMLRRLTRLEYNNTVRDLLGLRMDLFLFPERLPLASREYFRPEEGALGEILEVPQREYGARYPVLLPDLGLPGNNRAEHGFRNRGEAMNLSPLLLEKYLGVAREIVWSHKLPLLSESFARLIRDPARPPSERRPALQTTAPNEESPEWLAVDEFAPNLNLPFQATEGEVVTLDYQFRFAMETAVAEGTGGTWDASARSLVVPGGTPIRVRFGPSAKKALLLTPAEDLWICGFSTAGEVSGESLFTNHEKLRKTLRFGLGIEGGVAGEGITELAVCVLSRKGESGKAELTARFSGGGTSSLSHEMIEGGGIGNTFFAFRAPEGEHVVELVADGTDFSGNYLLLDDLAFLTDGAEGVRELPAPLVELSAAKKRAAAESRLGPFLTRVFRAPVEKAVLGRYLGLYDEAVGRGASFEEAMRETVAAALCSPQFLYIAETEAGRGKVRPLDGFEIATRLSYFLWSAPPDEALLEAAAAGRLDGREGIEEETRRMLRDPRVRELAESFAVQWLRLDQLTSAKPDPGLFKDFYGGPQGKVTLHSSMLVEALLLFETVLAEDRSVLEFLDADYTWLNLRLAKLYGIDVPELGTRKSDSNVLKDAKLNARWARVKLKDEPRGGYLTMAGPLTVTSLPTRTSPVKRGAWMLETILNRPPQEPKVAFVLKEAPEESGEEGETKAAPRTVRERFEQHRSEPACFTCHIRLDPPGFALERFDAVGAWRERDGESEVDARGDWAGQAFEGPEEFKALLVGDPHEFVRGLTEHLLSYALARGLELYDRPTVEEIEGRVLADSGSLHSLLVAITTSYPFRHLRDAE